jgi:hypothetical protein
LCLDTHLAGPAEKQSLINYTVGGENAKACRYGQF